jgi:hypothetical protein
VYTAATGQTADKKPPSRWAVDGLDRSSDSVWATVIRAVFSEGFPNAGSIMKKRMWKRLLAVGLLGGACLLQLPTCTQQALWATAVSSAVTAGGVLYIVSRVLND